MINKVLNILLIIYLAMGPIYWLPIIPQQIFLIIKVVIISIVLLWFVIYIMSNYIVFSNQILIIISFIIAVSSIVFIIQDPASVGYALGMVFSGIIFLLAFHYNSIFSIQEDDFLRLIRFIIILYITIPILSYFEILPEFNSPFNEVENDYVRFWNAGFGGNRAGWSYALGMFSPLILLSTKVNKNQISFILNLLFIVLLGYCIFLSGGRSGFLGFLIAISYLAFSARKYLFVLIITLVYGVKEYFEIFINFFTRDDSEDISNGRLEMFEKGFEIIEQTFLFGGGFKSSSEYLTQNYGMVHEMHNMYLRVIIDHGIILGTMMIFVIFFFAVIAASILINRKNRIVSLYALVVLITILFSMFEPNVIYGKFQDGAFFWFSAGRILKHKFQDVPD